MILGYLFFYSKKVEGRDLFQRCEDGCVTLRVFTHVSPRDAVVLPVVQELERCVSNGEAKLVQLRCDFLRLEELSLSGLVGELGRLMDIGIVWI